ncbi:hypothetical protein FJZ19_02575 [Candidatus Pacearchaeota archaeon]|nr:hypothetical protein [Candidatus Pacearchaeota archaeon]
MIHQPQIRITRPLYLFSRLSERCLGEMEDARDITGFEASDRFTIEGVPVTLLPPLKFALLGMERKGDNYSACAVVVPSSRRTSFKGLSKKIGERIGTHWTQTSEHGTGYIRFFANNATPDIAILRVDEDKRYEIWIGDGGTLPKPYGPVESFRRDLANLETALNCFVNSVYALRRINPKKLPLTLCLTC